MEMDFTPWGQLNITTRADRGISGGIRESRESATIECSLPFKSLYSAHWFDLNFAKFPGDSRQTQNTTVHM